MEEGGKEAPIGHWTTAFPVELSNNISEGIKLDGAVAFEQPANDTMGRYWPGAVGVKGNKKGAWEFVESVGFKGITWFADRVAEAGFACASTHLTVGRQEGGAGSGGKSV